MPIIAKYYRSIAPTSIPLALGTRLPEMSLNLWFSISIPLSMQGEFFNSLYADRCLMWHLLFSGFFRSGFSVIADLSSGRAFQLP